MILNILSVLGVLLVFDLLVSPGCCALKKIQQKYQRSKRAINTGGSLKSSYIVAAKLWFLCSVHQGGLMIFVVSNAAQQEKWVNFCPSTQTKGPLHGCNILKI